MARTKNQVITEVTDAAIANLQPGDLPEDVANQVTKDIEDLIILENIARGKGNGLSIPEVLPNPIIARLMNAMYEIRCVACSGLNMQIFFWTILGGLEI